MFQIQTDYLKQIRGRPVLSAPLELNKHLIIDGHQALDQRAVFVAGECTHTPQDGEGRGKLDQRFLLCFVWMTPATFNSVIFNYLRGSFHWRTLPSLSKTFKV